MFRRLVVTFGLVLLPALAFAEDIAGLRPWIPEDINSVAVIRAAELLKSPRAVRERWSSVGSEGFLGGSISLPPDCELFIRATRFHPGRGDNWSAALVSLSRKVDMKRVAEKQKSPLQVILNHPAVLSPRNCYFAQLTPQLLGIVSPAFRQDLARWIEQGERHKKTDLSSYLDEVLVGQSAGITLAIDLTEMFEPSRVKSRLAMLTALAGQADQVDRVAEQIQTLRGLRLDISIEEGTQGVFTLDFSKPVGEDGPLLKAILLEALGDLGASLDSFDKSDAVAKDKSLRIAATFTDEDLRRVMSLLLTPHPDVASPPSAGIASPPGTSSNSPAPRVMADNNVKYFRAVDQVLKDLTRINRKATDYAKTATWHVNFANKIEQLSALGVDPELVAFGESVSAKLRMLASSLQGVAVDLSTLNSSVVYNTKVNPGWESVGWWTYGYQAPTWETTSNLQEVRARQADAVMAGAKDRDTIWQMIGDERQKIIDSMTQKYGAEFSEAALKK